MFGIVIRNFLSRKVIMRFDIKLPAISHNSDSTSTYEVEIDDTVTLQDLVDHVLSNKERFGSINDATYFLEYRYGKIISSTFPEDYMKRRILPKLIANGSYDLMTYIVYLERKSNNG